MIDSLKWLLEVLLYVHRNRRFFGDGSPGRPPRLSHISFQRRALWTEKGGLYRQLCGGMGGGGGRLEWEVKMYSYIRSRMHYNLFFSVFSSSSVLTGKHSRRDFVCFFLERLSHS